jgi:hypothetical protein
MSCDASVCSRFGLVMHLYVAVVGLVCASSSAACSCAFQPTEQVGGSTPSSCAFQPTEQVSGSTPREQSMASASTSAASSSAFQPTEQVSASPVDLTDAWADIHKLGRFPQFIASPKSEAQHQENQAWKKILDAKHRMCGNGIPEDVWQEMQNYGASQPVDELQALICQVRDFKAKSGKCPTRSKTNKEEDSLAKKVAWNLNNRKFTAAQKRELKELQDGAPQPVVDLQALIREVKDWIAKHGKFPIHSKTNNDEKSLAKDSFGIKTSSPLHKSWN